MRGRLLAGDPRELVYLIQQISEVGSFCHTFSETSEKNYFQQPFIELGWLMSVILEVGRWRQEDKEFIVILSYMVSSRPTWAI